MGLQSSTSSAPIHHPPLLLLCACVCECLCVGMTQKERESVCVCVCVCVCVYYLTSIHRCSLLITNSKERNCLIFIITINNVRVAEELSPAPRAIVRLGSDTQCHTDTTFKCVVIKARSFFLFSFFLFLFYCGSNIVREGGGQKAGMSDVW